MNILTKDDLPNLKLELLKEIYSLINSKLTSLPQIIKNSHVKEFLQCSDSKLEVLRKTGKLPYFKILGTVYYKLEDLNKLFNKPMLET